VTGRETEANHILLAVAAFLAHFADALAQPAKERRLIYHNGSCRVL
jgi:hypothetical protein